MGFVPKQNTYKLIFADPDMAGLEVKARAGTFGGFLDVATLADLNTASLRPQDIKRVTDAFEAFADTLVSWNVETEAGEPVPANIEGMRSQPLDFMLTVLGAWAQAIASVDSPLPRKSNGGDQFPEGSIPMELLLPNPEN
jgi:hypothetical protein